MAVYTTKTNQAESMMFLEIDATLTEAPHFVFAIVCEQMFSLQQSAAVLPLQRLGLASFWPLKLSAEPHGWLPIVLLPSLASPLSDTIERLAGTSAAAYAG